MLKYPGWVIPLFKDAGAPRRLWKDPKAPRTCFISAAWNLFHSQEVLVLIQPIQTPTGWTPQGVPPKKNNEHAPRGSNVLKWQETKRRSWLTKFSFGLLSSSLESPKGTVLLPYLTPTAKVWVCLRWVEERMRKYRTGLLNIQYCRPSRLNVLLLSVYVEEYFYE